MECPKCLNEIPEGALFCDICGARAEPLAVNRDRVKKTWLVRGGITGAVLLVAAGITVLLLVLLGGSDEVVVPRLVGKTLSEAREMAAEQGLRIGQISTAQSATPADYVLSQEPESGEKLDRNGLITLQVSVGPADSTAPEEAEQPVADAQESETVINTEVEDQGTEADRRCPFFTIIIASLDQRTGHTYVEAQSLADTVRRKGLHADVLDSNRFRSLRRPYWVVYSGYYRSKTIADVNLPDVRASGYPDAYVRYVSYEGSGETGPIIP